MCQKGRQTSDTLSLTPRVDRPLFPSPRVDRPLSPNPGVDRPLFLTPRVDRPLFTTPRVDRHETTPRRQPGRRARERAASLAHLQDQLPLHPSLDVDDHPYRSSDMTQSKKRKREDQASENGHVVDLAGDTPPQSPTLKSSGGINLTGDSLELGAPPAARTKKRVKLTMPGTC
jgi:hypothetical protein